MQIDFMSFMGGLEMLGWKSTDEGNEDTTSIYFGFKQRLPYRDP